MKTRLLLIGAAIAAIALVQPLARPTSRPPYRVGNRRATAKLTLGSTTVSFIDADPDVVSSIPPPRARSVSTPEQDQHGANVILTLQAADDLKSGPTPSPSTT